MMGIKTGGIAVVIVTMALAGCSIFQKGADVQANPIVAGTISVAARSQCEQFAKDQPDAAKTTAAYLNTLAVSAASCVDGIDAGLATP